MSLFPEPADEYPVIHIEDTDRELPEHVVNTGLRYTRHKTIATGGKCVIQACHDYYLSRTIVQKALRKELATDPIERQRFLREARVSAMLQHPNTIPTYDVSRGNDGSYFFTMKLMHGSTLREVIDRCKESEFYFIEGYGVDRMVSILIQIGHALDYAHSHGVLHRDVKPANILMGPFGEVVLLDWGLAKVWNEDEDPEAPVKGPLSDDPSLTGHGSVEGTPFYMSPEQIDGANVDPRSDVYSLGAVLYESLTLEPMIPGDTAQEVLKRAKEERPVAPSKRAPGRPIPLDLEAICMRCVEKDPAARYPSANQLVAELRTWRSRQLQASR
jgi:serine/threonine-protein kinase